MPISLMPHVPDDTVIRRVEDVVKRHCQLHHAKTRGEMSRVHRHLFYDVLPQFLAYLGQLLNTQFPQVRWIVDAAQE